MTVTNANLIPARRILAKKRRVRIRRWTAACVSYAAVLAAAYAACQILLTDEGGDAAAMLRDCSAGIAGSRKDMVTLGRELQSARTELRANRAVGNQPDWSILPATVSAKLGDEVFLRRCQLVPLKPASPAASSC